MAVTIVKKQAFTCRSNLVQIDWGVDVEFI
jgi:hypothetical protein